jgi:hypothetical protein
MTSSQTSPTWIGQRASEVLSQSGEARVKGVTSRGVFLQTSSYWTIFLSGERFRGPLTINLPRDSGFFGKRYKSDYAQIEGGALRFKDGLSLSIQDVPVYTTTILASRPNKKSRQALKMAVKNLEDPLFTRLLDRHAPQPSLQAEIKALDLVDRMNFGDWGGVTKITQSLLGLGNGLTPEGDDFLIGLAFCLRQMHVEVLPPQLSAWVAAMLEMAEVSTTMMSANLLACAAEGQADERFYEAYKALCLGPKGTRAAINGLLGWGSSSGRMALAGIVAGLLWG